MWLTDTSLSTAERIFCPNCNDFYGSDDPYTSPLLKPHNDQSLAGFQISFQAWASIPNSNGSIPTISTKSLLIFYQLVRSCRWPCRVFDPRPLTYLEHCIGLLSPKLYTGFSRDFWPSAALQFTGVALKCMAKGPWCPNLYIFELRCLEMHSSFSGNIFSLSPNIVSALMFVICSFAPIFVLSFAFDRWTYSSADQRDFYDHNTYKWHLWQVLWVMDSTENPVHMSS